MTVVVAAIAGVRDTAAEVTAIVLLIVLLVEAEVLRGYGEGRAPAAVRTLGTAIAPLLLAAAVIVTARLADLL